MIEAIIVIAALATAAIGMAVYAITAERGRGAARVETATVHGELAAERERIVGLERDLAESRAETARALLRGDTLEDLRAKERSAPVAPGDGHRVLLSALRAAAVPRARPDPAPPAGAAVPAAPATADATDLGHGR